MTRSKMKKYVGLLILFVFVVTTIRLATSVEDLGISMESNRRLDVSIHPMRDLSNQSETLVERSLRGVVKRSENNQFSLLKGKLLGLGCNNCLFVCHENPPIPDTYPTF